MFQKATRKQAKLRLALSGPSGSGKTTGALMIAKGLGGKIAVLDTERGSASLYSDRFDFDVVELSPDYTPERYIEVIKAAEKGGYDVLIIDSLSHEWNGPGGCLELNESIAKAKYRGNTWSAWNEVTPRHRKLVDTILASPLHIICTLRSKTETTQGEVNGRKVVQKLGMKAEQRDGMDYEFTTVLDISVDGHLANSSKDRTQLFTDPFVITEDTGKALKKWLNTGKSEKTIEREQHKAKSADALAANPSPLSPEQRTAILAYLGERHGKDKAAMKAEMEDFLGHTLDSFNSITSEEASSFIDATRYGRNLLIQEAV